MRFNGLDVDDDVNVTRTIISVKCMDFKKYILKKKQRKMLYFFVEKTVEMIAWASVGNLSDEGRIKIERYKITVK